MEISVVDPELAGNAARDLRVEQKVVKTIEDVSKFTLATLSTQDHLLANAVMEVPAEEKVKFRANL